MKKFFKKLKLSQKLLIAPLVVLLFLVILSLLTYRGLSHQKVATDDIFNRRFKSYQSSSTILNAVANVHANIYRVISWVNAKYDSKKVDQLAKEQTASLERIQGVIKTILNSTALSSEEKSITKRCRKD